MSGSATASAGLTGSASPALVTHPAVSATGRQWRLLSVPPAAQTLIRNGNIPAAVAVLLAQRGISTPAQAERFLSPALDQLHDPYAIAGMQAAVERIWRAVEQRETILIYGDYDVDGTVSVVLLKTAIERLGGVCTFHVPHRLRDGYGMHPEPLTRAAADGVRLIISVDTGIRAFAAAEQAAALGLDLIVTDHHLPDSAGVPAALAVLNPNQEGCGYPWKFLCGAGVAFKLAQALLERQDRERAQTRLLPSFLKLLALATVADSVPLLDENRVFVALGLQQLRCPVQPGLRALLELAGLDPQQITTRDIAFRIAPRLNAAGRMDIAADVVELFTTRDASHARLLAEKLHRLNEERRAAEQKALEEINGRLAQENRNLCIVLDGQAWHRGVLGILASRIVERTGKPTLVLTHEDGVAHGSGRSVEGFHLLDALTACSAPLTRFGGHAQAVGFSLPSGRVEELRQNLFAYAHAHPPSGDGPQIDCHSELPLAEFTPQLETWLEKLGPYGMGNPEPQFLARRVMLTEDVKVLKNDHVKLRLRDIGDHSEMCALGWRLAGSVKNLPLLRGDMLDIIYKMRRPSPGWQNGREIELLDLAPSVAL